MATEPNIKAYIFDFNGVIHRNFGIDDELLEYIAELQTEVTTAVFTSFDSLTVAKLFEGREVVPFDHLFTRDNIMALKPEPAAYLEVAKELGYAPEECLMIDDSTDNIIGAQKAGMRTVHYSDISDLK